MRIKQFRHRPRKNLFQSLSLLRDWKKIILGGAVMVFSAVFLYTWLFLPSVEDAAQLVFSESTIIYDREALNPAENPTDHILYVIHGEENRDFVPLDEISPWVAKATIATEDDQFYSLFHWGFDIGGIVKGGLNYFFGIGSRRGGSTITQQLVKNTFLSNERSVFRKVNEILLSVKMELKYSKDEILEMYLNKIPYGHNAHGIESAARKFFGKSARNLTLGEAAILAGLPNRPTYYSPYGPNRDKLMGWEKCADGSTHVFGGASGNSAENLENDSPKLCEYQKGRKDHVLQRMLETKHITQEEFQDAWVASKQIGFRKDQTDIRAPHFVFYVRQLVEEKYGKEFLQEGGLRIYTTLDPELQTSAEETIATKSAHYPGTWSAENVALTSIDPDNGQILAYVGGKNYFDETNDGQVDVLTSRRQPGSSFKPVVYAAGFETGKYSPSTLIFDVETDFGGNYQPQNFDGKFAGPVSIRESLNRSLNIPAVKMAHLATPAGVLKTAEKIGIKADGSDEDHGVAIGIGVAEVEPLSHIASYQSFATDGTYHEASPILEIRNSAGKVLEKFSAEKTIRPGLEPEVAGLVRHILTDETTRPTTEGFDWNQLLELGKLGEYDLNNGAKTGTSNRRAKNPNFNPNRAESKLNPREITTPSDSWTIGFTPHLVAGVWVGNNKGKAMKPGATGMAVAAPIWKRFMLDAHEILQKKRENFSEKTYPYVGLEEKKINKYNQKIATENTLPSMAVDEIFASFSLPIELDNFQDEKSEIKKEYFKSLKPEDPRWQEPVNAWIKSHPSFFRSLGITSDRSPFGDRGSRDYISIWERYAQRYRAEQANNSAENQEPVLKNGPKILFLGPVNNQKTPINSTLHLAVSVTETEKPVKMVEFIINGKSLGFSESTPYQIFASTEEFPVGRAKVTARTWGEFEVLSEETISIIFERESIRLSAKPTISKIKHNRNSIAVDVIVGDNDVTEVEFIASKNGNTFFEQVILNPDKFLQFQVPRTSGGKIELQLAITRNGKKELIEKKTVSF